MVESEYVENNERINKNNNLQTLSIHIQTFSLRNSDEMIIKKLSKFFSSLITNIIENDPFPNIKFFSSNVFLDYNID